MCSYIRSFVELGYEPDCPVMLDFVPVDYVASAVTHISLKNPLSNGIYHQSNHRYKLIQFAAERLRARGFSIKTESHWDWVRRLVSFSGQTPTSPIVPFVPIYVETMKGEEMTLPEMYYEGVLPSFETINTERALEGTGITCPPVTEALIDLYLNYFQQIGYIPPSPDQESNKT